MTRTRPARALPAVRRWLAPAGLLLAVALGASGCAAEQAGAAAVVDGRRISVAQVQEASADLQALFGQPVGQQQALYTLVVRDFVVAAAARAGVAVSEDDARVQLLTKVAEPSSAGILAVQSVEAVSRLGNLSEEESKPIIDAVVGELKAADIELNPRYGRFDTEQIDVLPPQENWIVDTDGTEP